MTIVFKSTGGETLQKMFLSISAFKEAARETDSTLKYTEFRTASQQFVWTISQKSRNRAFAQIWDVWWLQLYKNSEDKV